jgi:hypothetical protein
MICALLCDRAHGLVQIDLVVRGRGVAMHAGQHQHPLDNEWNVAAVVLGPKQRAQRPHAGAFNTVADLLRGQIEVAAACSSTDGRVEASLSR